jgi:hypothetical protein
MGSASNAIKDITGTPQQDMTKGKYITSSSNNPNAALDAAEEAQMVKQEKEADRAKALSDAQTKQANIDNMNSIRASLSINKTLG